MTFRKELILDPIYFLGFLMTAFLFLNSFFPVDPGGVGSACLWLDESGLLEIKNTNQIRSIVYLSINPLPQNPNF